MDIATKGKEILKLIFGMGFSQLIFLLLIPILTRLFSPSDIGAFGAYLTSVATLVILFTGRYEMALVFCKNEQAALALEKLSIRRCYFVGILISILTFTILFLLPNANQLTTLSYLIFVIIGAFILGRYNIALQVILRNSQYKEISLARISHSIIFGITSIFSALIFLPNMAILFLSDAAARFFAFHTLGRKNFLDSINIDQIRKVRSRYSRFSNFEQMTALLSILSIQSPMIIIPLIFDAATAGLYFIVFRVVMGPVGLIANAVFDVFKVEASRQFHEIGECRPIVLYTISRLFLVGLIPTILIILLSEPLFILAFGESYALAGKYAQLLAPSVLFRFIAAPLGFVLQLRERVGLNTIFYGFFFLSTCLSLFIGWKLGSAEVMVIAISLTSSTLYLIQIALAYAFSGPSKDKIYS